MSLRVLGSPEKLADEIVDRIKLEIESRMKEALGAAQQILDKAYEDARRKLEEELRHARRDALERISSFTAKWEVEHRKKLAEAKSNAVSQILSEALGRLREWVGEDAYIGFLARLLEEAVSRLPAGTAKVVVVPAGSDRDYVAKAASRARVPGGVKLEIAGENAEGLGGFLVKTDKGVTLDYRLDVVLAPAIEEARLAILKALFPGQSP